MSDAELLALCDAADAAENAYDAHGDDPSSRFVEGWPMTAEGRRIFQEYEDAWRVLANAADCDTVRALILRAQQAEARITELEAQRDRIVVSLRELADEPKAGLSARTLDLALRRHADDIEAGRL